MPKANGVQDLGVVYCNFEQPQTEDFDKLIVTTYRFLTGQDVRVGDTVGDKTVRSVSRLFGVNFVHGD
jgi:hypothetical protein